MAGWYVCRLHRVAKHHKIPHILRMMYRFALFFLLVLPLTISVSPVFALAQSAPDASGGENTEKVLVLPPAYENQMMRLSEILGALHYLRELCGADEGQLWRDQMKNIIEKEEPTARRRAMMIARFNRGFRGFQETYRACTDAALEANNRYLFEGARLAGEIPGRYGR